jgi:transcriptional regulator with GAF, ATPase, and Fis domain
MGEWIQKEAARLLGLSSRVLNYKIKQFGITHPTWKQNR